MNKEVEKVEIDESPFEYSSMSIESTASNDGHLNWTIIDLTMEKGVLIQLGRIDYQNNLNKIKIDSNPRRIQDYNY